MWGMMFNVQKCHVMHVGPNNPRVTSLRARTYSKRLAELGLPTLAQRRVEAGPAIAIGKNSSASESHMYGMCYQTALKRRQRLPRSRRDTSNISITEWCGDKY
jgi:hypothetical protein